MTKPTTNANTIADQRRLARIVKHPDPTPIKAIHLNDGKHGLPKNPRFIKDDRFRALCDSIDANPEYMPARPIIVDEAGTILGGNMRYRACTELHIDPLPSGWVQRVEGWTLEKKRRFIIIDNRPFGEDNFDMLANEWDIGELVMAGFTEEELTGILDDDDEEQQADPPDHPVTCPQCGHEFILGE